MKKKLTSMIVVLVLLGAILTACNRPASEDPALKPTDSFPFPVSPTQGVSQFATQTAAAKQPAVVTATKAAAAAKTPVPTAASTTIVIPQPTAKPTEKPAVVLPTLTRPDTYTIQAGEFVICIARRYDLDLADLLAINGLTMSSRVSIGASLKIPSTGTWSANYGSRTLAAHPDSYLVKDGDTIGKIACLYGDVSPEGILANNGLKEAGDIKVGQTLQIP